MYTATELLIYPSRYEQTERGGGRERKKRLLCAATELLIHSRKYEQTKREREREERKRGGKY